MRLRRENTKKHRKNQQKKRKPKIYHIRRRKRVAKKKFKEDPTAGEKFISEAVGRLSIATKADDVLKTADLVVEAVSCTISFHIQTMQIRSMIVSMIVYLCYEFDIGHGKP